MKRPAAAPHSPIQSRPHAPGVHQTSRSVVPVSIHIPEPHGPVWDADAVSILAAAFDATPGATYAVEVRVSRAALSLAAASPAVTVGPALALRKEVAFGGAVTRGALLFGATLLLAAGTIALVAAWATRTR